MSRTQDATEIRSNCNFLTSQGSVVTYLRWSGNVFITYAQRFIRNLTVKKFYKSVYPCRSYDTKINCLAFWDTVHMRLQDEREEELPSLNKARS